MNICLFNPGEQSIPLRDERAQHLIKVLHKKQGDTFTAGIVGGKAGTATITKITDKTNSDGGTLSFTFEPQSEGKPLYPLTMLIGFPRPIQLKRLLRDMAGLGVCSVMLTGTELGEKSYMQSTLVQRGAAYKMLYDGTVQAGSTHVPEIQTFNNLKQSVECIHDSVKIALDNIRPSVSLFQFLQQNPLQDTGNQVYNITAAIGSERGWTNSERDFLEHSGFTLCGLGSRILRTETAATVAASLILAAMGKLL
ncbi:MAG: 16S rRNA (uracil(1498)-N(3))-methyltransferase [Treponema sp.]|nr:16S rRNA (uracil(1498)-N(3))-methyltransferase [Treponema sp.]